MVITRTTDHHGLRIKGTFRFIGLNSNPNVYYRQNGCVNAPNNGCLTVSQMGCRGRSPVSRLSRNGELTRCVPIRAKSWTFQFL